MGELSKEKSVKVAVNSGMESFRSREPSTLVSPKETPSASEPLMKSDLIQSITEAFPNRVRVCAMSTDVKVTSEM